MTITMQAYIEGRVQGVGFRRTAQLYARNLGVVGWVKNLSDRRVEMMVQGRQEDIAQVFKMLQDHYGNFVKHIDDRLVNQEKKFTSFEIKY